MCIYKHKLSKHIEQTKPSVRPLVPPGIPCRNLNLLFVEALKTSEKSPTITVRTCSTIQTSSHIPLHGSNFLNAVASHAKRIERSWGTHSSDAIYILRLEYWGLNWRCQSEWREINKSVVRLKIEHPFGMCNVSRIIGYNIIGYIRYLAFFKYIYIL